MYQQPQEHLKKKKTTGNLSGKSKGRKPYPRDENGNMIRPEKENQTSRKNKQNNNLTKNFLCKTKTL